MSIKHLRSKQNDAKWAETKARECVKKAPLGKHSVNEFDIELLGVKKIKKGFQVFYRAWKDGNPVGFGSDGSCEVERIRSFNPPIMVPDLVGFREDVAQALLLDIVRATRLTGKFGTQIIKGKVAQTTTVSRPNAGTGTAPIDGHMERSTIDETLATIIASAGMFASPSSSILSARLVASTTSNQYGALFRASIGFNTNIGASESISSATLQLWSTGKLNGLGDPDLVLVEHTPASEATRVAADYNVATFGSTELASRLTYASVTVGAFNDIALNASGISAINKTGNTTFGLRLSFDVDGAGLTWSSGADSRFGFSSADESGTTQDPVLTIEHTSTATNDSGTSAGTSSDTGELVVNIVGTASSPGTSNDSGDITVNVSGSISIDRLVIDITAIIKLTGLT